MFGHLRMPKIYKGLCLKCHEIHFLVVAIEKISRSEEFHFGGSSGGEMQHFMQFSVATFLMKCSIQCEGI